MRERGRRLIIEEMDRIARRFHEGKVPWEVIERSLSQSLPEGVVLGPAHGEDAALVRIGGELWAVASDPITFTAVDAGRLAVIVNANDVAVLGARPSMFVAVVLLSAVDATAERVSEVLGGVRSECERLGVTVIGGHTEVTPGLPRSLVVGTMLGPVSGEPVMSAGVRPGDVIGLTAWAGLEGTTILVDEIGERFRAAYGNEQLRPLEQVLEPDWLSIVDEALAVAGIHGVHALHDVTEGGVGEALWELASASGLRIEADRGAVPLLPETERLCSRLGLDPLGLIGSGALLVACSPDSRDTVSRGLAETGASVSWIGRAQAGDAEVAGIPRFPRDELLKVGALEGLEAILFDMDGTLVVSSYDWPEIRRRLGISGGSILDELAELSEPERSRKFAELEEIEMSASHHATEAPGARELLELLHDRGLGTALVTNNTAAAAEQLIRRFDLRFDVVITRDDGAWKPSGEPLRRAADALHVPCERCLAVGDSHFDLEAAIDAGCGRIGLVGPAAEAFGDEVDLAFPDIAALFRYARLVIARSGSDHLRA